MTKIFIGCDHAGFPLKEKIKTYLKNQGYDVVDKGAFKLDNDDDYPDFVVPVARSVVSTEGSFGIVFGGSGQGEAMSANKIEGIRATEYYGGDPEIIKVSREHNNANILSIGARFASEEDVVEVIKLFLETKFKGEERHVRRINKMKLESK
jgi:ribose 5-phosphate isomerase B